MSGRRLLVVVGNISDDALDRLRMENRDLRRLTVFRIDSDELPVREDGRYVLSSVRIADFREQHAIDAGEVHAVVCTELDWYKPDRPELNLEEAHAFHNGHADEWPNLPSVHVLSDDGTYELE